MGLLRKGLKIVVGATVARAVVRKVRRARRRRHDDPNKNHGAALVGKMCKIKSRSVSAAAGQAQHQAANGVTLNLDVRCSAHNELMTGAVAEITAYHPGSDTYDVKPH